MKNILILLFAVLMVFADKSFAQGDAPPFTQGLNQTTKSVSSITKVPGKQITKIAANQSLMETGNKNLLENPSFEHMTYTTGWTASGGTPFSDNSVITDGLKSYGLVASGTVSIYQDSSVGIIGFNFGGVQGLASIWINTTVQGLYVCPRKAGVSITSNYPSQCYTVQGKGVWELARVPFTLGGFSNGIEIKSTGAVAGNIYLDDAYVGVADLKTDSAVFDTQSYTATLTAANAQSTLIDSEGSGLFTVSNVSSRIRFTALKPIIVTGDGSRSNSLGTTPVSCQAIWYVNGTQVSFDQQFSASGGGQEQVCSSGLSVQLNAGEHVEFVGAIYSGGNFNNANVSLTAIHSTSSKTYSSTNADTNWEPCNFSTLAWQGLGTVTNQLLCKRQGGDLLYTGAITVGTTTASAIQIPLPLWNGTQLTIRSFPYSGSNVVGNGLLGTGSPNTYKEGGLIASSGLSYLSVGGIYDTNSQNPLTAIVGNSFISTGSVFTIEARIPIAGWENSNIMIGQFNGLESCTDSYQCTDVFSAKVSRAGVVSAENIDWIVGNTVVTSTSAHTFTFKSGVFTTSPNCWAQIDEYQGVTPLISTKATTTGVQLTTYQNGVGNVVADFTFYCQKNSADYIGKTAKAVASDQNLRTPGMVKSVIFSARVNSAGGVSKNKGGIISSGSCSGGGFSISFNQTLASVPNCVTEFVTGNNFRYAPLSMQESTTGISVLVPISNGTYVCSDDINIICHGETF